MSSQVGEIESMRDPVISFGYRLLANRHAVASRRFSIPDFTVVRSAAFHVNALQGHTTANSMPLDPPQIRLDALTKEMPNTLAALHSWKGKIQKVCLASAHPTCLLTCLLVKV